MISVLICISAYLYIDGLVQERRNSIANALELHLSCTNPSYWYHNILIMNFILTKITFHTDKVLHCLFYATPGQKYPQSYGLSLHDSFPIWQQTICFLIVEEKSDIYSGTFYYLYQYTAIPHIFISNMVSCMTHVIKNHGNSFTITEFQ